MFSAKGMMPVRTNRKNAMQTPLFIAFAMATLTLLSGLARADQIVKFQFYNVVLSDGSAAVGTFTYDFTTSRASSIHLIIGNGIFDNSASAPTSISKQGINGTYTSAATTDELALAFAAPLNPTQGAGLSLTPSASFLNEDTAIGEGQTLILRSGSVLPVVYLPQTALTLSGPPAPNVGWYAGAVTVTLTATAGAHPVAATYYTLDGGAAVKYAGPFSVSGEAARALTYWSVDASGFVEDTHSAPIGIDATPPATTSFHNGETVTLTATDAVSGVAATYYAVNGVSQQAYSAPFVAPIGSDIVVYWSVDNAGNAETAQTFAFVTGDSIAPTAPGSPYFAVKTATGGTIVWTASTDNVGVVGYIVEYYHGHSGKGGGYTWSPIGTTNSTFITIGSTYLNYSLAVLAYDAAGNKSLLSGVPSAVPPAVPLTGTLSLEGVNDLSQTAIPLDSVTAQFRVPGSLVALASQTAPLTVLSGGGNPAQAQFTLSFPPGTYDIAIKTPKNLQVVASNVALSSSSAPLPPVALTAGDANNDNSVDASDFGLFVSAYNSSAGVSGSGYDPTCDFNYDGAIDASDFGLFVGAYGSQGAL